MKRLLTKCSVPAISQNSLSSSSLPKVHSTRHWRCKDGMFASHLRCGGPALHIHRSFFGIFLSGWRKCVWGVNAKQPMLGLPVGGGTCQSGKNGWEQGPSCHPLPSGPQMLSRIGITWKAPPPEFLDQWVWGGVWEVSCPTDFQVMLGPLVWDRTWRITALQPPFQMLSGGGWWPAGSSRLVSVSPAPWVPRPVILTPHRLMCSPPPAFNTVVVTSRPWLLPAPSEHPSFFLSLHLPYSLQLISSPTLSTKTVLISSSLHLLSSSLILLLFVVCSMS